MTSQTSQTSQTSPTGLRRFVRPSAEASLRPADGASHASAPEASAPEASAPEASAPPASAPPGEAPERCELCATQVAAGHGHVADLEGASLLCACRACYLLFTQRSAGRGRYRAVPDRYRHDPDRVMTAADWDQLEIPVGLAFFLRSSREGGRLAGFYPSPAGATECILDLPRWERMVADYPLLGAPEPDVEAALISRTESGVEYFLVPVDACYELAGRMRLSWHGFDGGSEAREAIAAFLATVRDRVRPLSQEAPDG